MSKTKIVVIKRKQVIFTGVLALLALIAVVVLVCILKNGQTEGQPEEQPGQFDESLYRPGVYTSVIGLADSYISLEVTLDRNHISEARIVNLDEAVETMYPLVVPAIEEISSQLSEGVAADMIKTDEGSRYTSALLLEAIGEILERAAAPVVAGIE